MASKKTVQQNIIWESTESATRYVGFMNSKNIRKDKILRKYDKKLRRHVEFKLKKLSKN